MLKADIRETTVLRAEETTVTEGENARTTTTDAQKDGILETTDDANMIADEMTGGFMIDERGILVARRGTLQEIGATVTGGIGIRIETGINREKMRRRGVGTVQGLHVALAPDRREVGLIGLGRARAPRRTKRDRTLTSQVCSLLRQTLSQRQTVQTRY